MVCGCGQTYIVNEDAGGTFCNRNRRTPSRTFKDTSFKSFIGFLLLLLLFWVVISAIILTIQKTKERNKASSDSQHSNTPKPLENESDSTPHTIYQKSTSRQNISTDFSDTKTPTTVSKAFENKETTPDPINIGTTINSSQIEITQQPFVEISEKSNGSEVIFSTETNANKTIIVNEATTEPASNRVIVNAESTTDFPKTAGETVIVTKQGNTIESITENTQSVSIKSTIGGFTKELPDIPETTEQNEFSKFPERTYTTQKFETKTMVSNNDESAATTIIDPISVIIQKSTIPSRIFEKQQLTTDNARLLTNLSSENTTAIVISNSTERNDLMTTLSTILPYTPLTTQKFTFVPLTPIEQESLTEHSEFPESITALPIFNTTITNMIWNSTRKSRKWVKITFPYNSVITEKSTVLYKFPEIQKPKTTSSAFAENKTVLPAVKSTANLVNNLTVTVAATVIMTTKSTTETINDSTENLMENTGKIVENQTDVPTLRIHNTTIPNIMVTNSSTTEENTADSTDNTQNRKTGNSKKIVENQTELATSPDNISSAANKSEIDVNTSTVQGEVAKPENRTLFDESQTVPPHLNSTATMQLIYNHTTPLSITIQSPELFKNFPDVETCKSPICKTKVSQILQLMDHSIEPCEDFYRFSCGGMKNFPVTQNGNNQVDILLEILYKKKLSKLSYIKDVQKFYQSCFKYEMENNYQEKLKQTLTLNIRNDNLTDLIKFLLLRNSWPFFDIRYGEVDDNEKYGLQILPPNSNYQTVGIKNWSLKKHLKTQCYQNLMDPQLKYENNLDLKDIYTKLQKCQLDLFKKISADYFRVANVSDCDLQSFIKLFQPIMTDFPSDYDTQYALISNTFEKVTMRQLQEKYNKIIQNWALLFSEISFSKFKDSDNISIYLYDTYFQQIMETLENKFAENATDLINNIIIYARLQIHQFLITPKKSTNEQFCMEQTIELMPDLTDSIIGQYLNLKNFDTNIITSTFSNIKEQFYWLIDQSHLEEMNKKILKEKLENLNPRYFVDWKVDGKYCDEVNENIYFTADYLSNLFMFMENRRKFSFSLGNSNLNLFYLYYFTKEPAQMNPILLPSTGAIAIPNMFIFKLRKMQESRVPNYIIQTYLKYRLSEAIAYYLDEILQNSTSAFYTEILKYFKMYFQMDDTISLNGQKLLFNITAKDQILKLSTPQRIAAELAMTVSFGEISSGKNETVELLPWISDDYSMEQQFFILIAQEYCSDPEIGKFVDDLHSSIYMPNVYLIKNLMSNSPEFEAEFNCKPGSRMNPGISKVTFRTFEPDDYEYTN